VFKKKKTQNTVLPRLSYFILKVNLSAIEQWLPSQSKINASPEKDWKDVNIKKYEITILPTDPFTFHHKQVNEFSPSIGGADTIEDKAGGWIEWDWNQSYFYVNVSDPRITIFSVPTDEIRHLLRTGRNLSNKLEDEEVISLGSEEQFDEVYRTRTFPSALIFSNELVVH